METTTQSQTSADADKVSLNPDALNQLLGQMINDLGASVNGALVVLGDKLGIYTALADIGPATSQQLAAKTDLHERQLREWLIIVLRLLLDTLAIMREATLFFSLQNRSRCSLIQIVLPR